MKRAKYDFIVNHIADIDRSKITDPSLKNSLSIIETAIGKESVSGEVYSHSFDLFDFISGLENREEAKDKIRRILDKNRKKK